MKVKIVTYRGDAPKDVVPNSQSSLDLSSSTYNLTPLNTGEDATEFGDGEAEDDDDDEEEEEEEEENNKEEKFEIPPLSLGNTDVIVCSVSSTPRVLSPKVKKKIFFF